MRGATTANSPWRSTPSLYRTHLEHGHLRAAVEREFGPLKHEYGLAFLRVRRIERVWLHADLTMLARLALALGRSRQVDLVA